VTESRINNQYQAADAASRPPPPARHRAGFFLEIDMNKPPHTIALYESVIGSMVSDVFTFAITAGLVLLADGRSIAWQIITVGMFFVWIFSKALTHGKVLKFYSKREVLDWALSLPDDKKGGTA
jgi:hypothetical protein